MKKYKALFQSSRFFLIAVLFVSVSFWGLNVWSNSSGKTKQELTWEQKKERLNLENIKVENFTSSLTIVNTEIDKQSESVAITLRNDSKKLITGYAVNVGGGTTKTECLTGANMNNVLKPEEIRKEDYALQLDIDKHGIKIVAVIFDDNTTEGLPQYVEEIKQYRSGMKTQREHALNLLRNLSAKPQSKMYTAFNDFESKLSPFSENEENKFPANFRFGLQDEKVRLINNIKYLKEMAYAVQNQKNSSKSALQANLTDLINSYANTIKNL